MHDPERRTTTPKTGKAELGCVEIAAFILSVIVAIALLKALGFS